jgi:hypothetical protein
MPEITLNFNINITCDSAILNFLKTLQGIKPVKTGKQVSIPSMWSPSFVSSAAPVITTSSEATIPQKPPVTHTKKQYKLGGERIADEVLDQRIIDYVEKHQPCNLVWDKKTGTFPEDFLNSLKFYGNTKIRKHLIELEKKV